MKSALLIIDVQEGMFKMETPVHKGDELLASIIKLISFARNEKIPIIYVQHNGPINSPLDKNTEGWNIHNRIVPNDSDQVIYKHTPDSFYETDLDSCLKKLGTQELLITGIQTEACVDTTCRRAFSENYKVSIITDAHSTFDKSEISAKQIINHHNEVLRWLADTKSVNDIIN